MDLTRGKDDRRGPAVASFLSRQPLYHASPFGPRKEGYAGNGDIISR